MSGARLTSRDTTGRRGEEVKAVSPSCLSTQPLTPPPGPHSTHSTTPHQTLPNKQIRAQRRKKTENGKQNQATSHTNRREFKTRFANKRDKNQPMRAQLAESGQFIRHTSLTLGVWAFFLKLEHRTASTAKVL